ncbi:hypothetical protein O9929_22305 [Vibrio lentus]|nr:hypothetical protein [Vibrio lentus]
MWLLGLVDDVDTARCRPLVAGESHERFLGGVVTTRPLGWLTMEEGRTRVWSSAGETSVW